MITVVLIVSLFISELNLFLSYKHNTEMRISNLEPDQLLMIEFSIYFKRLNCYVLEFQHLEEYQVPCIIRNKRWWWSTKTWWRAW